MTKHIFLFFLLNVNIVYSQTESVDSIKTVLSDSNTTKFSLKQGFYKSYLEYLNNTPSIVANFSIDYDYINEKDSSTVVKANFTVLDDGIKTGKIWGFCDGKNVFVKFNTGLFNKYWRVLNKGKIPYCLFKAPKNSPIVGIGGPIAKLIMLATTTAIRISIPREYELAARNEDKDRFEQVNFKYLKKRLAKYPDLLNNFIVAYQMIEKTTKDSDEEHDGKIKLYQLYLDKLGELL